MKNICKQDTDKVLLVEGDNDCHVVMSLCVAHKIPETFGIYQCGSDDQVLKRLNALISRPSPPQTIGVMLDVDLSLDTRWESIRKKLRHYHYTFPDSPDPNGTILESSTEEPKLGFWLMPNNLDLGMLEYFCAELADRSCLEFASECVELARNRQLTTFKAQHLSKAIIHTYLAWQDEPGFPLGMAIKKKSLNSQTDIAIKFTQWLTQLFA
jgi:hypothetical protein